jgi:hypothetical protein
MPLYSGSKVERSGGCSSGASEVPTLRLSAGKCTVTLSNFPILCASSASKKNSQHHDLDPIPDADVDRVSVDGFSEVRGACPWTGEAPAAGRARRGSSSNAEK